MLGVKRPLASTPRFRSFKPRDTEAKISTDLQTKRIDVEDDSGSDLGSDNNYLEMDFTKNACAGNDTMDRAATTLVTPLVDVASLHDKNTEIERAPSRPREPDWRNSKWMPTFEDPTRQFWS